MNALDLAFLLFGQAIPGLSALDRGEVVDALNNSEWGAAILTLVTAIRRDQITVDQDLLDKADAFVREAGYEVPASA